MLQHSRGIQSRLRLDRPLAVCVVGGCGCHLKRWLSAGDQRVGMARRRAPSSFQGPGLSGACSCPATLCVSRQHPQSPVQPPVSACCASRFNSHSKSSGFQPPQPFSLALCTPDLGPNVKGRFTLQSGSDCGQQHSAHGIATHRCRCSRTTPAAGTSSSWCGTMCGNCVAGSRAGSALRLQRR
jgi:hypothetical protein